MKLFRVDVGGAHYWVAGDEGTPDEMVKAIEAAEGVTFAAEEWSDLTPSCISQITEAEARKLVCKTEGEPDIDLWTAAQDARLPFVVACSEW